MVRIAAAICGSCPLDLDDSCEIRFLSMAAANAVPAFGVHVTAANCGSCLQQPLNAVPVDVVRLAVFISVLAYDCEAAALQFLLVCFV